MFTFVQFTEKCTVRINDTYNTYKSSHLGIPRIERYCKLCQRKGLNEIEDETHFLYSCPNYQELRNVYLPNLKYSKEHFIRLMSSTNENVINALGMFLFYAFKKRSDDYKLL